MTDCEVKNDFMINKRYYSSTQYLLLFRFLYHCNFKCTCLYNIITLRIYIDVKLSTLETKATESSTNSRPPRLQVYRHRYSASAPKQRTLFYTAATRDTFFINYPT